MRPGFERCIGIDLPEDLFGAGSCGIAEFSNDLLDRGIADSAGTAIDPGLALQFVAQVFDVQGARLPGHAKAGASRIEMIESEPQILVRG